MSQSSWKMASSLSLISLSICSIHQIEAHTNVRSGDELDESAIVHSVEPTTRPELPITSVTRPCLPRNLKPFYYDGDQDTFGNSDVVYVACTAPVGYASVGGDCDDTQASVNPGADEVNDNTDNDCDGLHDEGLPVASSTFDTNAEGWTLAGDSTSPTPTWSSSGGISGGYISGTDLAYGQPWFFVAPLSYLGDIQESYGSFFAYDMWTNFADEDWGDVEIVGDGTSISYNWPGIPNSSTWTPIEIPLTEESWLLTGTDDPVEGEQFKRILSSVSAIRIHVELSNSADTGRIDNVTLMGSLANQEPGSPSQVTYNSR